MNGVIKTLKFTDSNGEKYNLYPRTLMECVSNHNQVASTITAGIFSVTGVAAVTGTDYITNRIRNTVFTTTDLGADVSTS